MTTLVESVTIKRARKEHQCHWCNESIPVGTSYVRERVVDGREAFTNRLHPECDDACGYLPRHLLEECFSIQWVRGCCCEWANNQRECNGDCEAAEGRSRKGAS